MRNENSRHPYLEASDFGALEEWTLVAVYNDKREEYDDMTVFLLQNKKDPSLGLLINDHHAGSALVVNVQVAQIKKLIPVTALCVCNSCVRGRAIADAIAGIAKSTGIEVVITRHCYKSGGVNFHQMTDKLPQTIK